MKISKSPIIATISAVAGWPTYFDVEANDIRLRSQAPEADIAIKLLEAGHDPTTPLQTRWAHQPVGAFSLRYRSLALAAATLQATRDRLARRNASPTRERGRGRPIASGATILPPRPQTAASGEALNGAEAVADLETTP